MTKEHSYYEHTDDLCGVGKTIHFWKKGANSSIVIARAVKIEYADQIVNLLNQQLKG